MSLKKTAAIAATALVGAGAFAQEGTNLEVDITKAEQAVSAVGTAIHDLISGSVTNNIILIIGAGLVITGFFIGLRYLLKGGKTAAKG